MKRRLIGKVAGYITYSVTTINKTYGDIPFVNPIGIVGDGTITYSSNNTTVATVNQNSGQVTIVKPGIATIVATVSDSTYYSYETKNITYTLNVAKAAGNVSEPPVSAAGKYTGSPQLLVTAGYGTGTMLYKLNNGAWSTSIPSATNHDTYTVYYKASENDYYTESSIGSLLVTILLSDPDYVAPTAKVLVYNNTELELLNAGSTLDGTFYYSINNSTWSESIPTGKNASTYTVYWKLEGDNNHTSVASTRIDVTIDKAENPLTATKHANWTYDGKSYDLISSASGQGAITYSLNNGEYSSTVPKATNAGTYTVKVKAAGNSNYYPKEISYTIVVSKVTPTVNVSSRTVTYNGSALNLVIGSTNWGTLQYSLDETNWSTTIPTATNVGTYQVYYKVIGNSNINDIASTAVSSVSEIKAKVVEATIELEYNTHVYTGEALTPSVTVKDGLTTIPSNEYTVSYSSNTNAGNASVTITDKTGGNYTVSGSATFTITKAKGVVNTLPTNKAVTYNGNSLVLANAGSGTGVMYYSLLENTGYTTSIPSQTNAGTYTLYFYAAESANYTQSDTGHISVTISKANPSYTAPVKKTGLIYNGNLLDLLTAGSTSDGVIKYSTDETTWITSIPTGVNATTYTVYWKVFGDSNHNDTASTSISVSIAKVTPTVTAPTAVSNLVYNTFPLVLANEGSTNFGTLQYSLSENGTYSTSIPTGTNAGSYDIWYKVVGDSNINNVNPAKITNSIAKANPSYVAPKASTGLVYSGENQQLLKAGSVSTGNGTLLYSSDNSTWGSTIPTGKNAGQYTSYWRIVGNSNYNDKASASIVTIIDKHVGVINNAPTAKDLTYNTTSQALVEAGSGSGTMQYKLGTNGTWSNNIPTGINADTYTVYYKVLESSNYYATDGSTYVSVSIKKVTPTVTAPTAKSLTYNGEELILINAGSTNYGTLKYSLDNSTYTTNLPKGINAVTYTVYYKVEGNSNVNDVAAKNITVTIAKADVTYTAPTANNRTYDTKSKALLNAGSVSGGTMQYSSDNSTWSTTIPSGTNAGNYTTYWRIVGDSNHKDKASTSIITTISKANGSVTTAPTAKSLTYNNTDQVLVTAGSGTGTMMYKLGEGSWSSSIPTGKNAGNYTVYYKAAESSNYNESVSDSVSINIAKVTPTVTAPEAYDLSYTGNAQNLVSDGSTNWGTLQYSLDSSTWNTNIPTGTGAGNYTVYYRVVGNTNINDVAAKTVSVTIAKVNPTYTAPTKKTGLIYNGSDQNLLNAGSTSHGTIKYSSDNSTWSTTIPTGKNVASYTVYWKLDGDANHNNVNSTTISGISIAKVTPTVTAPTPKTLTFNNANQVLANAGSTNFGTMQYCLNSSTGTYSTTVPSASAANVTYKVWYKVVGDSNINDVAPASIDCMIAEKRVTTPTITLSPSSYTYSGNQCKPTPTVKDGSVVIPSSEYTVTYSNNINAGTATVTISDNTSGNYYISGTTTFNIAKVTPTVTAPLARELIYNGNAQNLVSSGSTNWGTLQYSTAQTGTYSTTIPQATNAGSYEVWYKVVGDSNINDVAAVKVSCSIAKANGTATVNGTTSTYNGSAKNLVTVSNNTGTMHYKVDSGAWSTTLPQATNAGSWTIYWYMDESSNYNGIASSSTRYVSSSIGKANGSVTTVPTKKTLTYNNTDQALVNAGSGTGTMLYKVGSGSWSSSIPKGKNAGDYTVYYKALESTNYTESDSDSLVVTISKVTPTVTAPTAKNLTYTGEDLTLVTTGSTNWGTLQYSTTETGTYSTTIPTGKNAGNYNVWYKVVGNSNINDVAAVKVTITIKKADPTYTAPTAKTGLIYNTLAQALLNAGTVTGGTMEYSSNNSTWSTSIPTGTTASNYTSYWRIVGDSNHNDKGSTSIVTRISAKTVSSPTILLNPSSYTYSGGQCKPTPTVKDGDTVISSIEYTVSYENNINAGTTAKCIITDNEGGNYVISGDITFTINKVTPTVTAPTAKTLTYTGEDLVLANAGSTNWGTLQYASSSTGTYSTSIPTGKNAGTYEVWYKVVGNSNVNDVAANKITVTIALADMTYTAPTAKSLTYDINALNLLNAGTASGGTILYSTNNSTWSTTIPTGINQGSYDTWWKAVPDSNHTGGKASTKITVTIAKRTPVVKTNPSTRSGLVYNGSALNLLSGGVIQHSSSNTTEVAGSWSYTLLTNAGTYTTLGWTFTPSSSNYNSINGSITGSVTIAKASISPTVSMAGWTYEGTATNPSVSGNFGNGTVTYYYKVNSADDSTYTTTKPGSTSTATTYKVKAVIAETSNYLGATVYNTFTISKAAGRATISGRSLTYNGSSLNLLTVSGNTGTMHYRVGTSGDWSTTIPTVTNKTSSSNSDSWTIYYYMDASTNYNGQGSSSSPWGSKTTTMEKVTPSITAPTAKSSQSYTGSALALANAGSTNYGTLQYSLNHSTWGTSIPTAVNLGTYLVYYRVVGDNNIYSMSKESPYYYTVSSTSKIVEKVVTATVTLLYNTIVYDGTEKKPTVTVKDGSTTIPASEYTVSYSNNTNVGTATVTISDNTAGNYDVTGSATFSITRAACPASVNNRSLSFTNSALNLVTISNPQSQTIHYRIGNSGSFGTTIPTATNAGTYTILYYIDANSNYQGAYSSSNPGSVSTTIAKINLAVTEVNYSGTYDSSSHSSTVKVTSGGWDGKTIVCGTSTSYGTTVTSAGVTNTAYAVKTATNYTASTTIYYKITGGTNHNDYTDSVTFAISKKSTNAPILAAGGTTTYTGTTYYATAKNGSGNPAGTIYYGASSGATTYSMTASSTATNMSSMGRANVGTTTIHAFFRPTDTTNYTDSASASTTVTISNKATGYLTATTTNRTYNGSALTIATIASNSGTYYFGLGSSDTSAPSSWGSANTALSATTAGTYYVWAKCDTSTNYKAVAAKYIAAVTISARTVTVTAPTRTNRTYNGSAQTIFAAGSCTTGGTMYYSDTNKTFSTSTWSTSLPYTQKTDYGTYTIYYYCHVTDTANNTGSDINAIKSVSATINRGARSGAISCNDVTYGSTVTATVSVSPTNWTGGTVTWGITNGTGTATINSSGVVTPTKVGTVTVTATVGASGNYAGYTATSKLITIGQRTVTPTAPTATNRNYNGSAQTIFSGGSCTAGGTMYYSASDTTFSTSTWSKSLPYTLKTDAGTYTIYWYCYVSDTTNNKGTNINTKKSVSATINKVAATLPKTISGDSKDTDHTPARATVSKDYTGGTLQYSTDNGSTWNNVTWSSGNLTANPSNSTIGSVSVKFRVNPDSNHTVSSTSDAITLTVTKSTDASVTVTLSSALTYSGSAQTIATASNAHGLSSYYIGYRKDAQATADNQITWNSANTTPLQATNAGDYYVYYKYSVDSSHSGDKAYTYVGKVTINKKSRSGAVSCNNVTYGSTVTATVSGNTENGAITWGITAGTGTATISGGVVTPTKVGKVTVTASVAATANYAAYTATSKEITINLRTVTWSAPTRTNRTYNGSNLTIFTVGSCSAGGTMKYSSDNSTWSDSLPYTLKKEPGTYTIYYKCVVSDITNNTGTNINTSYSLQAVISKISTNAPVLTAGGTTTYTGTTYYATAKNGSGNPAGTIYYGTSAGSTSYSLTASTTAANMTSMGRKNVGTTTIYAFFRPTDTSHYSDSAGATTTVTISNKATGSSGSVSNPAAQTYKASGTYSYQLGISGATGTVTYPTSITVKNSGGTTISGWSCTSAGVVTVPQGTNAGSYTVTGNITVATSTNYNAVGATSKTWTITINKANTNAPVLTAGTKATYDGNYVYATAKTGSGNPAGTIYYGASSGSTSYSITASTTATNLTSMGRRDVGTTTIYAFFKPTDTTNYNNSSGATTTASVTNKATGSSGNVSNPAALTYKASGTYSYLLGITGNTGTVTYPTSITVKNSGNTTISGWSCTSAGVVTVPAATTAGSYTVTGNVTIAASTNYNAVSATSKTWTITINKAGLNAPTATVTAATYPGTSSASASGGGGQGSIEWSNGSSRSAIGSQTTKARWSGNSNYNASPYSNEVTLSVAKFTPTVTLTATDRAYNGNPLYATASVATPSGGKATKGTIYYGTTSGAQTYSVTYTSGSVNLSSVSVTNVGSATVYAYFVPDSTCNDVYNNSGNASKKFTVSKANQSAPTATDSTVTYNSTATGSASGGGGVGTLYYKSDASGGINYGSATTTAPTRTNIGTTKYIAYWGGNGNYNASPNSAAKSLVVNKYTPTVTLTATNRVYNGSALYASATVSKPTNGKAIAGTIYYGTSSGATTYSVTYNGSAVNLTSVSVTNYNNGSGNSVTVYAYFVPNSTCNDVYNNSGNVSKTMTITGKANQNAPTATGATTTYNTTATATASGGGGQGGLEWSNGNTQTSVGSKTTKARWKGNGNYNASAWSNEVTVKMNKANPSITTTPTNRNAVYTGSALNLLQGGAASVAGSFSYSTGTNAGSYTATWTFTPTDTTNYNTVSGLVSATIAARPINITAASASKAYDGTALTSNSATAETTGTNRGLVSGHSMTSCTVTGKITNAGTANNVPSSAIIKSGTTDVTSNYAITYVNGTLTVTRAKTASVIISNPSVAYSGTNQGPGITAARVSITGTTSAKDVGTYTFYATPTSNYAWSDGTYTQRSYGWQIITNFKPSGSDYILLANDGEGKKIFCCKP